MTQRTFREVAGDLWLVGALTRAKPRICLAALYEFIHLLCWSFLPFALGGLVLFITLAAPHPDFFELAVGTFRNGELLVFTISMLAPTLFLVNNDPENAGPFPHKLPFSTIGIFVLVVCGAVFALLKAGTVKNGPFVFELSVYLTLLALLFRYLAMVYHRVRMPESVNESDLRSTEHDFVKQMKKRVGEE